MGLKERITILTSPAQVDTFLSTHALALIFKAGTCHKTNETFARIQPVLEASDGLPIGVLRVVEARAASDHVAETTGVRHESPQMFLFKDGRMVMHRSDWDITEQALVAALEGRLAAV
jgi:bacillithiol system protein YtxJ